MKRIRAAGTWLYQEEIVASPPDGGYAAWSVVLGAGLIIALASGLQFTFGILYVTLLEEFAQPPAVTSGVVSTEFFCMLGCGVLSGRLVQRFGARRMASVGGALIGIGFITSSFATSLYPLFVTIGLVIGCGCSMALNSASSHPPRFFVKWRSTAAGIAVASSGIGTMTLAPLIRSLISEYGWRVALRVLGVLCCTGIILAAQLFRPLPNRSAHPQSPLGCWTAPKASTCRIESWSNAEEWGSQSNTDQPHYRTDCATAREYSSQSKLCRRCLHSHGQRQTREMVWRLLLAATKGITGEMSLKLLQRRQASSS